MTRTGRAAWLLLGYSSGFVIGASAHLLWLLWRYVPLHAAVFEGMGIEIPGTTRMVVATSIWVVRLLPFMVILSIPVAGVVAAAIVVIGTKAGMPAVARSLATLGLVVALGESAASAFVVHAIHAAYRQAATDPGFQQSLQAFQEFRKQQGTPKAIENRGESPP